MTLTTKEQGLLADLKDSEVICIQKYNKYANEACDAELKNLFCKLSQNEQTHLEWLTQIQNGTVPDCNGAQKAEGCNLEGRTPACKDTDTFLCKDALSMEKHVSSVYDISVFEFSNKELRKVLNTIQTQEQNHGEQIYSYMSAHNMY